ncbi:MAG: ABC transporter, partial [Kineosporiaceae bacterium]
IGGSTGAGKSTLTNSLAGKEVSRSGVLRPTTRSPILVHHPYDSGAFLTQRILPGLDRITSEALEPVQPAELDAPRITALRLVPHEGMTPGLALLDAPDIDSVVEANRNLAVQLLGAGDLWLFVTTAARYGDAMPWQMLRDGASRGASVAVVLDRVPPESMREVRADLARKLRDQGLGSSPVFTIPEVALEDGLLPARAVAPLVRWLNRLAADPRSREMVIRRTLTGALDSLPPRIDVLVAAGQEQESAFAVLRSDVETVAAAERSALITELSDGTVLRGEVLARWHGFVAGGDLMRHVERAAGRLTDRIAAVIRRPAPLRTDGLEQSLEVSVRAVIGARARSLADGVIDAWSSRPGGSGVLPEARVAARGAELDQRVTRLVRSWQATLSADLAEEALPAIPVWASTLGASGITALVMVATFSFAADEHTARTGAPADAAATATALARRVLEALFGEGTIRPMLLRAHAGLVAAAEELCDSERSWLHEVLDAGKVHDGAAEALRQAAQALDEVR